MPHYKTYNGAMPTTSSRTGVTTGTAIKTMLQLATPSTRQLQVISWGFSMDQAPATTGSGVVELIQTDVAATVTASVAADVHPLNPDAPASLLTLGTTSTGYTATAEGATTATRLFDATHITGVSNGAAPTSYAYQFMPDERPTVAVSRFLRVRATFTAAVNMIVWICWDE